LLLPPCTHIHPIIGAWVFPPWASAMSSSSSPAPGVVGIVWDALLLLDAVLLADPDADCWYVGAQDQTDSLYAELLAIWVRCPSLSAEGLVNEWFLDDGSSPPIDSCLDMPPWLVAGIMMGVPGFPSFS